MCDDDWDDNCCDLDCDTVNYSPIRMRKHNGKRYWFSSNHTCSSSHISLEYLKAFSQETSEIILRASYKRVNGKLKRLSRDTTSFVSDAWHEQGTAELLWFIISMLQYPSHLCSDPVEPCKFIYFIPTKFKNSTRKITYPYEVYVEPFFQSDEQEEVSEILLHPLNELNDINVLMDLEQVYKGPVIRKITVVQDYARIDLSQCVAYRCFSQNLWNNFGAIYFNRPVPRY